MKIFTIYKATNSVNGRVYIGFDSLWPRRISNHRGSSQKEDTKFYRAIRKHGFDSFIWEPIYQSLDQDHTLKVMEPYFIKEYNSKIEGYNSTLGGDGVVGLVFSEESRLKMSKSQRGLKKPRNPNLPKRKLSEAQIKYFVEHVAPLCRTPESRAKQSKTATGRKKSKEQVEAMKTRWQDTSEITCPHCGRTGQYKNMMRWHMDRCKHNPNQLEDLFKVVTCEQCNYTSKQSPNFYRYHGKNCTTTTDSEGTSQAA